MGPPLALYKPGLLITGHKDVVEDSWDWLRMNVRSVVASCDSGRAFAVVRFGLAG